MSIWKSILLTLFITFISSCSEQQFAFRQKVRVKNRLESKHEHVKPEVSLLVAPIIHQPEVNNAANPSEAHVSTPQLVSNPTHIEGDSTKRKKYNFDDAPSHSDRKPSNDKSSDENDNSNNHNADNMAIAGFILSLTSLLLFFTFIPGFIFSLKGLKSRRYKGLAIAGLVISSIYMVLAIIFLLYILFFIFLLLAMIL